MGQKVKHRKLIRRSGASFNGDVFSGLSNKEDRPAPYSSAYASTLSHADECQYLHQILTSNLPYYTAKVKLSYLEGRVAKSWQDAKNHNLLSRLTVSGLSILQTQFAKKPKNPV